MPELVLVGLLYNIHSLSHSVRRFFEAHSSFKLLKNLPLIVPCTSDMSSAYLYELKTENLVSACSGGDPHVPKKVMNHATAKL